MYSCTPACNSIRPFNYFLKAMLAMFQWLIYQCLQHNLRLLVMCLNKLITEPRPVCLCKLRSLSTVPGVIDPFLQLSWVYSLSLLLIPLLGRIMLSLWWVGPQSGKASPGVLPLFQYSLSPMFFSHLWTVLFLCWSGECLRVVFFKGHCINVWNE